MDEGYRRLGAIYTIALNPEETELYVLARIGPDEVNFICLEDGMRLTDSVLVDSYSKHVPEDELKDLLKCAYSWEYIPIKRRGY